MKSRSWIAVAVVMGLVLGVSASIYSTGRILPVGADPDSGEASSDAEWLALIDNAAKVRRGEIVVTPATVEVPQDVTQLSSCQSLPEKVHFSGVSHQPGDVPGTGRTVMTFTDVTERGDGPQFLLVVDWAESVSDCDLRVRRPVNDAKASQVDREAHICDQMQLAADRRNMTDATLRQPSAEVATEYIKSFCHD